MTEKPSPRRGLLRLVDAEAGAIAAARARQRMGHLRPYVPSWDKPRAMLLRPVTDTSVPRQPCIAPPAPPSRSGRLWRFLFVAAVPLIGLAACLAEWARWLLP